MVQICEPEAVHRPALQSGSRMPYPVAGVEGHIRPARRSVPASDCAGARSVCRRQLSARSEAARCPPEDQVRVLPEKHRCVCLQGFVILCHSLQYHYSSVPPRLDFRLLRR